MIGATTETEDEMIEPASREELHSLSLTVNGKEYSEQVNARALLSDFLRHRLGLYGTHVGCEQGVCGACTVIVDGRAVRSCLMFAVQADDAEVMTIEGLVGPDELHPIQEAFWEEHALQCGFCTPGIVLSLYEYLGEKAGVEDEDELREALSGNVCRCTGYINIARAAKRASYMVAKGAAT